MDKETCTESSPSDSLDSSTKSRTLYLILQGEFVLYCDKTTAPAPTLRILAPNLDDHCYIAGPWLDEKEIPSKRLELRGVRGGSVNPEELNDTFLKLRCESNPNFRSARVDISAPLPLAILSGLMDSTHSVVVTVWDKTGMAFHPTVCLDPTVIPILVYKWYEGEEPPFITDASSGRRWQAGGSDSFRSIHVYATSRDEEDSAHSKRAFHVAAHLLGHHAAIDWLEPTEGLGPSSSHTVEAYPGLSWAQVNLFLWQRRSYTLEELMSDKKPFKLQQVAVSSGNCGPVTA